MGERTFNEEQQKAIAHFTGPCLVLAGPGSGKTTVITYRIKELIEKHRVKGSNILVITFTRAAAEEMKERFETLVPREASVTFGTFHSVFLMMLRRAYGYNSMEILMEGDKYAVIKNIIEKHGMNYDGQEDFAKLVVGEIGYVKSDLTGVEAYESVNMKKEDFQVVFKEYNDWLAKHRKIDFDDMLVMAYELLKARPDIRALWQQKFKFVLIDEFQDINRIQYEVVKLLLSEENNIFVVGDDDQSVYSFRGANTEIMLGFPKDFENTEMVCLNVNYRCTRDIVEAALRVINNNEKRYKKELRAGNDAITESVHIETAEDVNDEFEKICGKIRALVAGGANYRDFAILFRTNSESTALTFTMLQNNVPFKMKDMLPDILSHFTSINMMDYIHVALGDRSRGRFLRIINKPNRYISRDSFESEQVDMNRLKELYCENRAVLTNIEKFERDLDRIAGLPPFSAINYIRRAMGYDDYLKEYADYKKRDVSEYTDILDEFQEMAKDSTNYTDWFELLKAYKEETTKASGNKNNDEDMVTLSTFHSSKGLEFKYVFIVNAIEGTTPHKKSVTDEEIEEERRMFYVAITRAKKELYLYVPDTVYGKGARASRFVNEMCMEKEMIYEGNTIYHKQYGKGTITYVDDKKFVVFFEEKGISKTLSIEHTVQNKLIEQVKEEEEMEK